MDGDEIPRGYGADRIDRGGGAERRIGKYGDDIPHTSGKIALFLHARHDAVVRAPGYRYLYERADPYPLHELVRDAIRKSGISVRCVEGDDFDEHESFSYCIREVMKINEYFPLTFRDFGIKRQTVFYKLTIILIMNVLPFLRNVAGTTHNAGLALSFAILLSSGTPAMVQSALHQT